MQPEPILLYHIRPTRDDVCLKRLTEFFGLSCRTVETSTFDGELERAPDHDLCVLANATTIDRWCHTHSDPAIALDGLCQKTSFLFLYGFAPGKSLACIASRLSDGAIEDVRELTGAGLSYQVSSTEPGITKEFSGLSFGCARNDTDSAFVCTANSRGTVPLVSIDDMPFWVVVEKNFCKTFLLACSAVADIQEQVNGIDVGTYFSRLLPAAMFLRAAFKGLCWHGRHRLANFIIDDPPLKSSYGYLNYRNLLAQMDKCEFASTIAFIPWNYRRTDNRVAQLFRERMDRLSLCVHGCDHTTAEFSSTDLAVLNSKVQLASARMNSLERRNGLSYSKTMVFPQGRFSTGALTALKANNYLAAVNSSPSPAYSGAYGSLTVADFLTPAVTRYGGFPVFVRRYPDGLEQFAFDLFFGKPLLAVEHHAYFKDGGARLAEFIIQINSFKKLQWTGLQEIMKKSYLEREISDELTACRLYTNHHVIENQAERDRTFILTKFEAGDVPIQHVLVNGLATRFTLIDNVLEFATRIPAHSSTVVEVVYENRLPDAELKQGFASRSHIWAHRMLSEFRDNVLCRSGLLLASAQVLRRGFSGRGAIGPQQGHVPGSERRMEPERRFEVRHGTNGHGAASSAPMWRKTDNNPARASASASKNVCPGDIARGILGADSGASISKVLVVGTDGSELVKRMEIHFADPQRVPAAFTSLAAALQSSGFDFNPLRNSSIPATEIWLTYPLNDRNTTLLSCAARVEEQQITAFAVQSGSPRGQTDKPASASGGSRN
jgi:hypothetical protein